MAGRVTFGDGRADLEVRAVGRTTAGLAGEVPPLVWAGEAGAVGEWVGWA